MDDSSVWETPVQVNRKQPLVLLPYNHVGNKRSHSPITSFPHRQLITLPMSHLPNAYQPPNHLRVPANNNSPIDGRTSEDTVTDIHSSRTASSGMLSTAINYLADKRKRFQRSDTAPTLGFGRYSPGSSPCPSPELKTSPVAMPTTRNLGIMDLAIMTTSMITVPSSTSIDGSGVSPPRSSKQKIQKSPDLLRVTKDYQSMEDIASRRAHSVDFGRRIKVSPKAIRNSPSVPSKLNKYTFVKRLTRYNSARSMEELKREFGRNEKIVKDANELFSAIDRCDYTLVKQILNRRPVLVNTFNDLELSPLDMALLLNSRDIAELIINSGGYCNPRFSSPAKMQLHLGTMINDLAKQIVEVSSHTSNGVIGIKDFNKDLVTLQNTHKLVSRLKINLYEMLVPCPVNQATLEVSSLSSILVMIAPPSDSTVLKYRIEWSYDEQFLSTEQTMIVDAQYPFGYYEIIDLSPGIRYFVRVAAMNLKGWSGPRLTLPRSCVPSSWSEIDKVADRSCTFSGELGEIKSNLDQELCFWLTNNVSDKSQRKSPLSQRKRSLKNLFSPMSKFVRHAKKGVYLALVCDCEDKIVLAEDLLPLIPVDEVCPTSNALNSDSLWLMRLMSDFPDLKLISQNVERLSVPTSLEFRVKLLFAAQQLQTSMGTSDIGKIYPEVFTGSGVAIIVITKSVEDFREVSLSSGLRWSSTSKLNRKIGTNKEEGSSGDGTQIISPEDEMYSRLEELSTFGVRSGTPVSTGLYLCFLRLKCHVDQLEIQHPNSRCNLPPSIKIRDNPHVSKEEWSYLKSLSSIPEDFNETHLPFRGESCETFHKDIVNSWCKLREQLRLKAEDSETSRIYLNEVVSLSPDVSLIFVFPAAEKVCSAPGAPFSLPIEFQSMSLNAFEIFLFLTYEPDFFARYATLSATLDFLSPIAQQVLRQSFHDREIVQCRRRVEIFTNAQARLEEMWKLKRWSVDIINTARERPKSSLQALSIVQLIPINNAYRNRKILKSQQVLKPTFLLTDSSSYTSSGDSGTGSGGTNSKCFGHNSSKMALDNSNKDSDRNPPLQRLLRGTLRVFAGYHSGLAEGTSVRLLVNSQTTAREIINLVVLQLNQTALTKNSSSPVYTETQLTDFSLTVSIGVMERPLPEAFHPLLLQDPWKKGKLIIRRNSEDDTIDIADTTELATDV